MTAIGWRHVRRLGLAAYAALFLPVAGLQPRPTAAQESPVVTQALRDIERYEGLAAAMAPGDKAAGRKYMGEIGPIGTRLRTAPNADPRLREAVDRFNALQKRVVDTANAAAAVPAQPGAAAAPQPAGPSRLTSSDQARLNRVAGNIRSLGQRIESATLPALLDEREVANLRTSIANNRGELESYPADAAGVAEAARDLDVAAAKLESRLGEAKARGAALGDVESQLAAIDARIKTQEVPK